MDFRGRMYRAGVLHFHERDFSRSLIPFYSEKVEDVSKQEEENRIYQDECAAAFKHSKFYTIIESVQGTSKNDARIE